MKGPLASILDTLRQRARRIPWLQAVVRSLRAQAQPGNPAHDHLRILLAPGFDAAEDFADQYYRLVWYLRPLGANIASIDIPHRLASTAPGPLPRYLDPAIAEMTAEIASRISMFDADDAAEWRTRLERCDIMLRWRSDLADLSRDIRGRIEEVSRRKKVWDVDRITFRFEGSHYLRCSHDANPRRKQDLADCRRKFDTLARVIGEISRGRSKGYLMGTGPSIAAAREHDFSDGVPIICNSIVRNGALLRRTEPRLIAIADPIFHAGCSSYAGEFRRYLIACMERYRSHLVVPFRDYPVYMQNLPERLGERIVGIPLESLPQPNLDLNERFEVAVTSNILTLFLLPLAATFFDEIAIMGCDGRPMDQNGYFWSHDKESQLNEQMELIQEAHPGFFNIDYDDYYLTHCEMLECILAQAEKQGKQVSNLTFSHIPALRRRSADSLL